MAENGYCCYIPDCVISGLSDMTSIKCMYFILKKCRMAKQTESISLSKDDVKGLSKKSFYNAIKKLEEDKWIYADKTNCHIYKITLIENYHFTRFDLDHLKGKNKYADNGSVTP
ncbi:MAG: hypothetical protein OIN87_09160 [Candidatus Methanoperedens sp.]|nr:hypothetical protein [Candidatus Methanoperedens sp.]